MLPEQLDPKGGKNKAWVEQCALGVRRLVRGGIGSRSSESMCYDIYFGHQEEKDYEYLTGSGEARFPARVRIIPIGKPYFDLLQSTCETRPMEMSVFSVDSASLDKKKDMAVANIVDTMISSTAASQERIALMRMQLDTQKQAIAQGGQNDPAASLKIRTLEIQLKGVEDALQRGDDMISRHLDELEEKHKTSARTQQEIQMTNGIEYLMQKYGWRHKFDTGFIDLLCVDNEIYKVEEPVEGEDPQVRKCDPLTIFYGATPSAYWIDECSWVLEEQARTITEVLDEYGEELTQEQITRLQERRNYSWLGAYSRGGGYNAFPSGSPDVCAPGKGLYGGSMVYSTDLIPVYRVEWKSVERIRAKYSPNKYDTERPFVHVIKKGDRVSKEDKVKDHYRVDWWEATVILEDIVVKGRKKPHQFRDTETSGNAYGSYIGYAYNGQDRRPYSTVWAVKDLLILYNLVYYQFELLMALSGIRGVIMDKAQIPQGMSFKDWFYWFKQGLGIIDSMKKDPVTGRTATFNQFQQYDLSFGNAIAQLNMVMERIESLVGRVIGIPPQRLGEVQSHDQVGTHRQAIAQSNLTTETKFIKHERVVKRVMDRVVNVCARAWKNGRRGAYIHGKYGQKIFEITQGDGIDNCSYEMFFGDNGRNQEIIQRMIPAVEQSYAKGGMMLGQLLSVYESNNLNELREGVERYEKLAMQHADAARQGDAQAQQQLAQATAEMEALVKKTESGDAKLKAQVDQTALQLERERLQTDAQVKIEAARIGDESKRYVADQTSMVELAYLDEQKRKTDIETRLSMLEMQMNKTGSGKDLSSTRPKNEISDR